MEAELKNKVENIRFLKITAKKEFFLLLIKCIDIFFAAWYNKKCGNSPMFPLQYYCIMLEYLLFMEKTTALAVVFSVYMAVF